MGVGLGLLEALKAGPGSSLGIAPPRGAGLITGTGTVENITDSGICKAFPAPDNCRVFTVRDLEN
jgi:hypothetical protein